jgi:hypothetical protein
VAYLKQALLLGFWPGSNTRYLQDPALERDRPLWRTHIPAIRAVTAAGWEPISYATASPAAPIERFGRGSDGRIYLTTQAARAGTLTLTLDLDAIGARTRQSVSVRELLSGQSISAARSGHYLVFGKSMAAEEVAAYELTFGPAAILGSRSAPAPGHRAARRALRGSAGQPAM